jgi:hypothetical protein
MVFLLKKVMLKEDRYRRKRTQSELFYQSGGYQKVKCLADGICFRGTVD